MGGSIIRRILSVSLSPVSAVRARTVQTELRGTVAPLALRPGACAWRARARHTGLLMETRVHFTEFVLRVLCGF